MRRSRLGWMMGAACAIAVVIPASIAWACVGLMSLTSSASVVQPGGTVTLTGREFASGAPVQIHLDGPAGPLLATAPAPTTTMTSEFTVDVTIPPDVPEGEHVLVAVQQYHNMNAGSPARSSIYVGTPPAVGAGEEEQPVRPAQLIVSGGPGAASLVTIGLVVAAVALLLAGFWSAVTSGRPERAPETVRGS